VIIGTAGHIDHGKTALVRALTGVDTDRLKEEKARGITIDLGFAYLPTPDGAVLGFVDVPGHEKFVHNMLAGATGIDFVLLVIAADDGVMPQTQEHLAIVDLLGIGRGIVALTKTDLVSAERSAAAIEEVTELLSPTALAGSEIIPVSAITGEGVGVLRARLIAAAQSIRRAGASGRARLAVDRCFTLQGAGTVVTGTVLSGAFMIGDHVIISPSGREARVRSIHAQNRATDRGETGQRCALNLVGDDISKDAIARGDVVLDPALHAPIDRVDAVLRVLVSEQKPVGQWMPVRLHCGAIEVGARIALLSETAIPPGSEGFIQLVLERPIAATAGDRFVLRDTSAQRTIGGGRFVDLQPPARKRRTPERLAQLQACAINDPAKALAKLLDLPPNHLDLSAFARDRALMQSEIDRISADIGLIALPVQGKVIALSPAGFLRMKRDIVAALATYHADNPDLAGIGRERLRLQVAPRLPGQIFTTLLQGLARTNDITLDGAWVRLPGHEARLSAADEALWRRIEPLIGATERFRPPRVRDLAGALEVPEPSVRRLLKLLGRMGRLDEVAHDHFFLRSTVAEMVAIAVDLVAQHGQFTAAQFRDRVDNGRKVAIQILEFFDRHGVTLRRGDLRHTNKHRLDLFGAASELSIAQVNRDNADKGKSEKGRESSPVGRSDFKSVRGREPVFGGFDSHSLPPPSRKARRR
jgi:selenocysteine-specific elongation factor